MCIKEAFLLAECHRAEHIAAYAQLSTQPSVALITAAAYCSREARLETGRAARGEGGREEDGDTPEV